MLGSFFSTYPTAESFPRSASNHVSETKSREVEIISGLALILSHKKGGIIALELHFDFSMDIILSCAIYLFWYDSINHAKTLPILPSRIMNIV